MRLAPALSVLVIAVACPGMAFADELKAQSKVEAVTVFPQGAEVTRSSSVKLPAGDQVILLNDLPGQAVASSIRVEGKASGRLEIGSVDARVVSVPRSDAAQVASERKRIEDEIEKLRDQKTALQGQITAADSQRALLNNLANLPNRPSPPQGSGPAENWDAVFATIGARMADVMKSIQDGHIKIRETDRKIEDLNKQLAGLAPRQDQRIEVRINAAASAPLDATLTVRYQVPAASWTPHYDARLTTGSKAAAPRLLLIRRSSIQQRTGEDWTDVAMTLSTTRPGGGTAAPDLGVVTVDFEPDAPPPGMPRPQSAPVAAAPSGAMRSMAKKSGETAMDEVAAQAAVPPPLQDIANREAQTQSAPFQALYLVPGKQTVKTTGEVKRVQIDQSEMEPALLVRTVPKQEAVAYLYANLKLPAGVTTLPGQVALFRDGTFVGNGRLPLLNPSEDHELGFGADDAVRVKYARIEEKRGEKGLISSSKTDARNFKITVKNLHDRPIGVTVIDQLPVSTNQDIKVELSSTPKPSKQDLEDKRGIVAWELQLAAQEEKEIVHGYVVSWPSAKRVIYGISRGTWDPSSQSFRNVTF